ncbi:MAG: Flp family type IVb pilin [Planctomycetota bacterium]|jgi:pilus assembly protein Flp/PilA
MMKGAKKAIARFISDERGLETVEYAVIAALITLAAIATITTVGALVNDKFTELATKLAPTP